VHGGVLKGTFPGKGLRFPKEEEKEPFRTFAEIEAVIAAGQLDDAKKDVLWEALYLMRPEVEEFLAIVRKNATLPWRTRRRRNRAKTPPRHARPRRWPRTRWSKAAST
jgi:hypothetical protein